jgi:Trk K+ transport system NAD-binding subunit
LNTTVVGSDEVDFVLICHSDSLFLINYTYNIPVITANVKQKEQKKALEKQGLVIFLKKSFENFSLSNLF